MLTYADNISICLACDKREWGCHGPCRCTVDEEDIADHARSGSCPLDLFGKPLPLERRRPNRGAPAPKPREYIVFLDGSGNAAEIPSADAIIFFRMEYTGDLLVILPAMKHVKLTTHRPVWLVTDRRYLPLLSRIPWLNLVGVDMQDREMVREVFPYLGELRDLEPDYSQRSWSLAAFSKAGVEVGFYDVLPLEIENRDHAAEQEILKRFRLRPDKPLILLNTVGKSSPFTGGDALREHLAGRFANDFEIVDLSKVVAPRIIDLLGLYEAARCIVSTDTATLHLAYATKTPTVALTRDREGPNSWGASFPRSHWIARVPYSTATTPEGLKQICDAIAGVTE